MSDALKNMVREKYAQVVTGNEGCCGPACCGNEDEGYFGENYTGVNGYHTEADYGLGCGIPTDYAQIQEGDTVLDLGSGAGNDVFVARRMVGETGKVIGVDFTEAMVNKAEENRQKLGYENVEFLFGEIESLPVPDESVDVIVSNCVMNLVPDKKKAYQKVYRVMKSGGHISISDIVLNGDSPEKLKNAAELYAGCVAGAMEITPYLETIKKAGFSGVEVVKQRPIGLPESLLKKYLNSEALKEYSSGESGMLSITVIAKK